MSFRLIELNPNKIVFGEENLIFKEEESLIYEHLRYYCSKFFPLPAISVRIRANLITITSRFVYLKIAKELNHSTIRAIVDKESDTENILSLEGLGVVKLLNIEEIRKNEKSIDYSFHVFFFERPLELKEKIIFEEIIQQQFKLSLVNFDFQNTSEIFLFKYTHEDSCVEFKGLTPFENHTWASDFRQKLIDFDSKVVKIISYQGRRFS